MHAHSFNSSDLQVINPLKYNGWDELIKSSPQSSIFHSSCWARVLTSSYGYKPAYFSIFDGNEPLLIIPFMEIRSALTGTRGVSLPFSDYCQPAAGKNINSADALNWIIKYGRQAGWLSLEFKDASALLNSYTPSRLYHVHTLRLSQNEEDIFSGFRDSTRRNIKKAVGSGVRVTLSNSLEATRQYYRLHVLTRKRQGLPPQPFFFFKEIYAHILCKNYGTVALASQNGKNIAGAMFFQFHDKAYFKYGASDRTKQHLRASNLVMWESIRLFCSQGIKSLCFGRTALTNKGLLQFKNGWGCEQRTISYYRYNMKTGGFVSDKTHLETIGTRLMSKLPLPVLELMGNIFYRHVG